MAEITLSALDGSYSATLDTREMDVKIEDAFLGVRFVASSGEELVVFMRDGGFELDYSGDFGDTGFNRPGIELKNGVFTHLGKKVSVSL